MPNKLTEDQRKALFKYRSTYGVSAPKHSQKEYYKAYYGQEDVEPLFKDHPFIQENMVLRAAPCALGFVTEMYLHPELNLEQLADTTSPQAVKFKKEAGDYLKAHFLEPKRPEDIEAFNKMFMTGAGRIADLLKAAFVEGRINTKTKIDDFDKTYGLMINGLFDVYNQRLSNDNWNKAGIDPKQGLELFGIFGSLALLFQHRNESQFLSALEHEGKLAKVDVRKTLMVYFVGDLPYRQAYTDLLTRSFKLDGKDGFATELESLLAQNDLDFFAYNLLPKSIGYFGILAKLDHVELMALMSDPKLQDFLQVEATKDNQLLKAVYAGRDLRMGADLNSITPAEIYGVRKHMYSHMSHELALALYPTLGDEARQFLFDRYLKISQDEYNALDDASKKSIRNIRAAKQVIPEVSGDGVIELAGMLEAEADKLYGLTKGSRTSAEYQKMEKTLRDLGTFARMLDLPREGAENKLVHRLELARYAVMDYLVHKHTTVEPQPGESFKNDYERSRVEQARQLYGMLSRNLEALTDKKAVEKLHALKAELNEYESLHRALAEKKGVFGGSDTREYKEMMAALETLQQEIKELVPREGKLTEAQRLRLDELRAEVTEKTATYIAEKKDLDKISMRAGIRRAEAARKLLDALNRGQNNAYRQAAKELEPVLKAAMESIRNAMNVTEPNQRGTLKAQMKAAFGKGLMSEPMGQYYLKNLATIAEYISDDKMKAFFRETMENAQGEKGLEDAVANTIAQIQERCQGVFRETNLVDHTIPTMVQMIQYNPLNIPDAETKYKDIVGSEEIMNRQPEVWEQIRKNQIELLNARIGKAMEDKAGLPNIDDMYKTFKGDAEYFARRDNKDQRLAYFGNTLTRLYTRLSTGKMDDTSIGVGKLIYDMVNKGPFTKEELRDSMPDFHKIYTFGALANARRMAWGVVGGIANLEFYPTRSREKLEPEQARLLTEGSAALSMLQLGELAYERIPDVDKFLKASGKLTVGHRLQEMTGEKALGIFTDAEKSGRIGQQAVKDALRVMQGEIRDLEKARSEARVHPVALQSQEFVLGV